jgi:uncharacterized sporulation protein YeaH/YhbH (DUF444 family)
MKKIARDFQAWRDLIAGKLGEALRHRIHSGQIFKEKGKDGKISISLPKLDIPQFIYGKAKKGVGRGPGKVGDVIDRENKKGKGSGAGQGSSEGIEVQVDLKDILKMLQEELSLPNLLPKPSETFEEIKKRYVSLSRNGPNALIHKRKTIKNTLKRQMSCGGMEKVALPGFTEAMTLLRPINDDIRFRQFVEHKIPASNAIIFFARDGSASMDEFKCEVVSDIAWWIDLWIRHHYEHTERVYVWHDSEAYEVGSDKFYNYRYGGGTTCSSALKLISKQLEHRYPPHKYNIYIFYFSDGDNWSEDNEVFIKTIKEELGPDRVNFIGCTQIMCWNYDYSLNKHLEEAIKSERLDPNFVRTAYVSEDRNSEDSGGFQGNSRYEMSPEDRDRQVKEAIKRLLGSKNSTTESGAFGSTKQMA